MTICSVWAEVHLREADGITSAFIEKVPVLDAGERLTADASLPVEIEIPCDVVALRTPDLRNVAVNDTTVELRMLLDRRGQLRLAGTETAPRLHHLLLEIIYCSSRCLDQSTLSFFDLQTRQLLRTRRNPLTADEVSRLRGLRSAGPPPTASQEPVRVQRRVSDTGVVMVARQPIALYSLMTPPRRSALDRLRGRRRHRSHRHRHLRP